MGIHDHFDGSAHCVECGGSCKLTGATLTLTQLVRALCEAEVVWVGFRIPQFVVNVLEHGSFRLSPFRERAKATNKPLGTFK